MTDVYQVSWGNLMSLPKIMSKIQMWKEYSISFGITKVPYVFIQGDISKCLCKQVYWVEPSINLRISIFFFLLKKDNWEHPVNKNTIKKSQIYLKFIWYRILVVHILYYKFLYNKCLYLYIYIFFNNWLVHSRYIVK